MLREKVLVVPVLEVDGELQVVLVTSRADGNWILPKGNPEPDLTVQEVAAMEAWEEAGVRGELRNVAAERVEGDIRGRPLLLDCFLMDVDKVAQAWPEDHERRRCFVGPKEAHDLLVDEPSLRRILDRMVALY